MSSPTAAAADYDPFCVTVPSDSRLPGGGNQICGLYDIKPLAFGRVDNVITQSSNYGAGVTEVFNGVDLTLQARFANGAQLGGGVSTGRTVADTCALNGLPQVGPTFNLFTADLASSFRHLDKDLAKGRLTEAEARLKALEEMAADDTRLGQYQRQLADAWLKRGQDALQQGDLDNAARALSHARGLMPQAPALTAGLDGTLDQAGHTAGAATAGENAAHPVLSPRL